MRADGHEASSHLALSSCGGCEQQLGSGHFDVDRCGVPWPVNHFTWAKGTPTLMENSPPGSTRAVHQKVPSGVSVYWKYGLNRSSTRYTARDVNRLHANCPSTEPRGSWGKGSPSLEYAL